MRRRSLALLALAALPLAGCGGTTHLAAAHPTGAPLVATSASPTDDPTPTTSPSPTATPEPVVTVAPTPATVAMTPAAAVAQAPVQAPAVKAPAAAPAAPVYSGGAASSYTLNYASNGAVVRWNPCRTITYKVNLALAPAGALATTQQAVANVAAAAGLTMTYTGTTDEIPSKSSAPTSADIVIGWAARGSTSALPAGGSEAGEGGWFSSGVSNDGAHWTWQIVGGFVALDTGQMNLFSPGFGSGTRLGTLLEHETMHALGLGHTQDRADIMYPIISSSSPGVLAAGDRAGLAKVGAAAGCV
jgi:hypothetical protein